MSGLNWQMSVREMAVFGKQNWQDREGQQAREICKLQMRFPLIIRIARLLEITARL
jgi:hypothetical protein